MFTVRAGKVVAIEADAWVAPVYEGEERLTGAAAAVDRATGGMIRERLAAGDFKGKLREICVLYPQAGFKCRCILVAGLGKKTEFRTETVRAASAATAQKARALELKTLVFPADSGTAGLAVPELAEAVVEGAALGLYRFEAYRTQDMEESASPAQVILAVENGRSRPAVERAVERAQIVSGAVRLVRDLVSTPPGDMTPAALARVATDLASNRRALSVEVLEADRMREIGMNALLGVGCGSHEAPKFIILTYHGAAADVPPIVLVGKGVTFDSGGLSLKSYENMEGMKDDMAGGAVVLATMAAAADLSLPLNLVGLVPAAENLPGGGAYKPGDVLKSLSGRTIEVMNTDAEGRLLLADALNYAERYEPQAVIDVATLTGACVVALGPELIGLFGNDDALKARLRAAGDATGEAVWELPLWRDYDELIKSDIADFKNTGGREGGAITAALFLSKFVGPHPWAHLDIAGPVWAKKDRPIIPKGASGVGVRLLVRMLRDWPT